MPTVRLHVGEVDGERLPAVCICCGTPVAVYRDHEFWTLPRPVPFVLAMFLLLVFGAMLFESLGDHDLCCVFFLPLVAICFFLMNMVRWLWPYRVTVTTPLCGEHQYYWRVRKGWRWLGMSACMIVAFSGAIWSRLLLGGDDARIAYFICAAAALLGAMTVSLVVRNWGIHSLEQTPSDITLTSVSRDFVRAVDAWREARAERLASHSGHRTTAAEEPSAKRDSTGFRPPSNIAEQDRPA
jgi:hypothetical protein